MKEKAEITLNAEQKDLLAKRMETHAQYLELRAQIDKLDAQLVRAGALPGVPINMSW